MAKRRKRRSQAILTERAMKDIRNRNLHREHLRQISTILTNTLGFPVKVSLVRAPEVSERKKKRGKVERKTAHVAGYHDDPPPQYEGKDQLDYGWNDPEAPFRSSDY